MDVVCELFGVFVTCAGGDGSKYKRETKKAFTKMCSEIYSPPRITKALSGLPGHPLVPGFALDLTCVDEEDGQPWDFDRKDKRTKALELVRQHKPLFVVLSPACTAWCSWQQLNNTRRPPDQVQRDKVAALVHLKFAMDICREQINGGRYFLFEHPRAASSWGEDAVQEVLQVPEVKLITADQCQF